MNTAKRLLIALFVAAVALGVMSCSSKRSEVSAGGKFGKTLVAVHDIPASTIADYGKLKVTPRDPNVAPVLHYASLDGVAWRGPAIEVTPKQNPYTVVVRMDAIAPAAGPANSVWMAGLQPTEADGNPTDTGMGSSLLGRMNDSDEASGPLAAGRGFTRVNAATPVSFKKPGKAVPWVELKEARNLKPLTVRVEVWQGFAETTFLEAVFGFRWALVGLVGVALWWFWFRKSD